MLRVPGIAALAIEDQVGQVGVGADRRSQPDGAEQGKEQGFMGTRPFGGSCSVEDSSAVAEHGEGNHQGEEEQVKEVAHERFLL